MLTDINIIKNIIPTKSIILNYKIMYLFFKAKASLGKCLNHFKDQNNPHLRKIILKTPQLKRHRTQRIDSNFQ